VTVLVSSLGKSRREEAYHYFVRKDQSFLTGVLLKQTERGSPSRRRCQGMKFSGISKAFRTGDNCCESEARAPKMPQAFRHHSLTSAPTAFLESRKLHLTAPGSFASVFRRIRVVMIPCLGMAISLLAVRAADTTTPELDERTAIAIEALSRLKGMDLEANPGVKAAVSKVLDQVHGRPQFVELVRDFKIKGQEPALVELAIQNPGNNTGADAARLLLENEATELIRAALKATNAVPLVEALGNTSDKRVVPLLEPLVPDMTRDPVLRKQAVRSLALTQEGAAALLKLAREAKLPGDLKLTAAAELHNARWDGIKTEAAQLLPLPQGQNAEPLPPISELTKRTGNAAKGAAVFRRETVGCIRCHQVNGEGVDFGPNLSEIGTKLGKDAIYESILDPSAGISFGFEAWQIELQNGDELFGLIASETADEVAVKAQTGIITRCKKSDIIRRQKQTLSIMPSGLQQTMSTQELVDLVEYLSSLRKAAN
jgi:putative heme-binding domain-containing protein